ncbi:hypothetical protein B0W47_16340 [Komagataeibacter nataicola]|uniref:Uncharacterized protein n=2 Tax=Komagataeibacter nataicola TaxID=265960 RepID=A0A9N7CBB5_9PROT|nr:hypothetical protein [Komagataeibacter nataicola]AQU88751.1 hypothetical protein B0W47_16340 [Komagataeibacter nataicola]PYD67288.1 hypothetical protein CDI09_03425 [Komagataeibacter nataicola]WEQ56994.1 hypothetical protein LV564_08050 [Komagataeibacter nataicola]WNM08523.1 hypothetical protein RI056_17090 [Komagataeibacter nataicola]
MPVPGVTLYLATVSRTLNEQVAYLFDHEWQIEHNQKATGQSAGSCASKSLPTGEIFYEEPEQERPKKNAALERRHPKASVIFRSSLKCHPGYGQQPDLPDERIRQEP